MNELAIGFALIECARLGYWRAIRPMSVKADENAPYGGSWRKVGEGRRFWSLTRVEADELEEHDGLR